MHQPHAGATPAPPSHRRHRRDRNRVPAPARAVEPLEPRCLLAASLVADLNALPAESTPSHFTRVGDELYFFATDAAGRELWKTDGTAAGTVRVVDLNPGPPNAVDPGNDEYEHVQPDEQIAGLNGTVFFTADDGSTGGFELFKTDGTAAGTALVKDLNAPAGADRYGGAAPTGLAAVGDELFFTATSDDYAGVWKTDGTAEGTVVLGTAAKVAYSERSRPTVSGGLYYFTAYDAQHGWELWKSDGTPEGTGMVKDIIPGVGNGVEPAPGRFIDVDGTLFFVAAGASGYELWRTDGTEAGTVKIRRTSDGSEVYSPTPFSAAAVGRELYFPSENGLWKTDGTVDGTVEVRSSSLTGSLGSVRHLTAMGGRAYFVRNNQLWVSDGTPDGTGQLVQRFSPDFSPSNLSDLTAVGDRLYLTLYEMAPGRSTPRALWASDGTAAGTVRLARVPLFSWYSNPPFTVGSLGGSVFFPSDDGELWRTDGTPAGTGQLQDLYPGTADTVLAAAPLGGELVVAVRSGPNWGSLVKTGGNQTGTTVLRPGGTGASTISDMEAAVDSVFFYSQDQRYPRGLWKTDGTAAGTVFVSDLRASESVRILDMTPDGRNAYLSVYRDDGYELWKSDGTPGGSGMLRRVSPRSSGANVGDTFYFPGNDAQSGVELWKTDGTPAGTGLVKEIVPGLAGHSDPGNLTPFSDALLFTANDMQFTSQIRVWRTDGTAAGTVPLTAPGVTTARSEKRIGSLRGVAYFGATDGTADNGAALWQTDGTPAGTSLLAHLPAGFSQPDQFTAAAGVLFFRALDRDGKSWLWQTDGTEAGTFPLRRFEAPAAQPIELAGEVGGLLLFAAEGVGVGRELWKSDGTEAGTVPAGDIFPGAYGSYPERFVRAGDALYFTAIDPQHGRELWKYTPDILPQPARVVGRHVFYNHSAFDGNDAGASAADDGAIAADKQALVAGEAAAGGTSASVTNVTSYSRGINGVMVDVAGLPPGAEAALSAADFDFGSAGLPVSAPASITVRRGAGVNGSDRVTLAWADGAAVRNGWLHVTIKGNERTGLSQPDVFSFGNLVGDTGDSPAAPRVNALDLAAVKRALGSTVAIDSRLDFNRDGRVNALDLAAARQGLGNVLATLDDSEDLDVIP